MRQIACSFFLFVLLATAGAGQVLAEKRVALVIGNSDYRHVGKLRNPKNDAQLMAATLRRVGFAVTTLIDVDQRAMKKAMRDFGRALRGSGAVGLFYYAGHGVQVAGENYLIPVNANLADESEIEFDAVNVNAFLQTMERASSRINIVILDACRNNPFARSFRSATRGLARVDAPRGTYIAYATSPGDVAQDGKTGNSPYTSALAKAIELPGLTIEQVFKQARNDVLATTQEQQVPWETSSITGEFFFGARPLS
ncbi:MAG: caspase family protein, partial [Methyloligellaceae bacterium]